MNPNAAPITPLVSVVVPNYNHADYLDVRIQSILAQTFQDFELILLDDASTDGSVEIIEKYSQTPGVRILRNEKNSGSPFPQWNRGAAMARGEFLWIAEADDESNENFLATMVALLTDHPNVVLAYCQSERIDSQGASIGDFAEWTTPIHSSRWNFPYINNGTDEVCKFLVQRNTIVNASSVLMRRAAFLKAGGAPSNLRLVGDWVAYCHLLKLGDIAYSPQKLNRFRCHNSSVRAEMDKNQNWKKNIEEYIWAFNDIAASFPIEPHIQERVCAFLADWWFDCVQNSHRCPPLSWALKTSGEIARHNGTSRWDFLDRYLRVRAWKTPGIKQILTILNRWFSKH